MPVFFELRISCMLLLKFKFPKYLVFAPVTVTDSESSCGLSATDPFKTSNVSSPELHRSHGLYAEDSVLMIVRAASRIVGFAGCGHRVTGPTLDK